MTQAGDAFGRSVGNERVGLYSPEDIRGFDPIDAGNARIEGLYFDQRDRLPSRLIDGNTIRVGISAQRYPFPAPTGIVDYRLTLGETKEEGSFEIERGPFGGFTGSIDVKLPVAKTLAVSGGVGWRDQIRAEGGRNQFRNFGIVLAWRPYQDALITPFYGGYFNKGDEARSVFFPASNTLPDVPAKQFLGQDWTDRNHVSRSYGAIAKLPIGAIMLEAGLFRSQRKTATVFSDFSTGVQANGASTNRVIIADGNNYDGSTSGEMRLTYARTSGTMRHKLFASVRGRAKDRRFGGVQRFDLGPGSVIVPQPIGRLPIQLGADDSDKVRQWTAGVGYGLEWDQRGSIDVSASKAQYRMALDFADPRLPSVTTKDDPLLWSATASVFLSSRLALYGGYVRGLEEAPIAPEVATNRDEAPPAVGTRQVDFGLRYTVTSKLTLIAGLFSVKKPYFNLDPALKFRPLGAVDNRGVEVSLSGQLAKGVAVVAGSIFLDPSISGEAVDRKLIGQRPVGSLTRRSILNLDWRLDDGASPLSLDLAFESLSSRVGNSTPEPARRIIAPAREAVNLGGRYRFYLGPYKALLRLQMTNLLNASGWQVSSSGAFSRATGRTWTAQLAADF